MMPVSDPHTCAEITRLHDAITAIGYKFDAHTIAFQQHAAQENEVKVQLEKLLSAFPDGVENHRSAHEAMIRAAKAQEDFYTELRKDLAKAGIIGAFVILFGFLTLGIQAHIKGWFGS